MAHAVQPFIYTPLDLAKHEIRLLRLQARMFSASDEIECELFQVNLDAEPRYEALSYEWGPPVESPSWISVDGNEHRVRENLSDALRDLRLKYEPRILWIDALCINQDDTMERNHQVARMGDIYRNATRVIVWVGREQLDKTSQDDALIAISFLEDTKRKSLAEFIPGNESKRQSQLLKKGYDREWQAVLNLCRRHYWTRLWIIQEVILATNIIVHCGQLKFTWGVLTKLFAQLEGLCQEMSFETGNAIRSSVPARLDRQRLARKKNQDGSPILDLMFTNVNAMCVDVRDKVFGVHSLMKPCCRMAVPIDYSKT
ncbi:HET-domain-containing protein, partial [Stipitochalara longipes BDJ]